MGLLDKLWDDVIAGPQPDKGLGRLRKHSGSGKNLVVDPTSLDGDQAMNSSSPTAAPQAGTQTQGIFISPPPVMRSSSFGDKSTTPTGSPSSLQSPGSKSERETTWRHLHPGSMGRKRMESHGSARYDNAHPNSPSVYDWMYNPENRNKWQ